MKFISLNCWGGKLYLPLIDFIKTHSKDTDIFCFQEVFYTETDKLTMYGYRLNLYQEVTKILSNYNGYFYPTVDKYVAGSFTPDFVDFDLSWGLTIFINKRFEVISEGDFFIFSKRGNFNPKDWNSLPRNVQYINFRVNKNLYTVCNLHGIWIKGNKNDSPTRISQSNQIIDFFNKQKGKKILVGDFNLNMDTQSINLLEKNFKNLIKKYKISTTRNKLFPGQEKFADYTFVSKDIKVKSFEVPKMEVSDHLPMILEFE